jgi:hypothetical protein
VVTVFFGETTAAIIRDDAIVANVWIAIDEDINFIG